MTTTLTAAAELDGPATTPARSGWLSVLRRHWLGASVIAAGVVLRILVMIAYPRAFWIQGDSQEYLGTADFHTAGSTRPSGYGVFLAVLQPFGSVRFMVGVQHLIGVAIGVAGYVFLCRRGVPRVIAAIAIAPILLDGRTVTLEHFLLSETFFTALLVAGCLVLLWRDRPGIVDCAVIGLLFAGAALTRSVGAFLLVLPALYLIARRVGWRPLVAFALAIVAPFGGYLVWAHASFGQYSLSAYSGRFLWARTTTFMDCGKLNLTPQELRICPKEPVDQRPTPDQYLWSRTSVVKYTTQPNADSIHLHLALKAIAGQPGDFLAVAARDTWDSMIGTYPPGGYPCQVIWMSLPPDHGASPCEFRLAPVRPKPDHFDGDATQLSGALMTPLSAYSSAMSIPGLVSAVAWLLALGMAFRRRGHWPAGERARAWLDPLLMTSLGLAIIVISASSAGVDTRYAQPALPLSAIGVALAFARFRGHVEVAAKPTVGPVAADLA
jgi:hypothetical protein